MRLIKVSLWKQILNDILLDRNTLPNEIFYLIGMKNKKIPAFPIDFILYKK